MKLRHFSGSSAAVARSVPHPRRIRIPAVLWGRTPHRLSRRFVWHLRLKP